MTFSSANAMINLKPLRLEGRHIKLVPLELSHYDELCHIGLDADLWRLTTNQLRTPEDMRIYVQTALDDQATGLSLPFVIVDKESGRLVGSSRYHSLNQTNQRLVIGHTWIARNWQRTVVNTEAKYLMLQHAFEQLGCNRVEFIVNSINDRSRNAMLRIGAKHEGVLRSYTINKDGQANDVALFSIVATEWPNTKITLEQKLARSACSPDLDLKKSYDSIAADYAKEFSGELENKPFDRKMLDWLVEKAQSLGPICDMGCGPGQIAKYLHERGAESCGIDLSPEMVREAQLLNPQIQFAQGDMLALDKIEDGSLGGIAAFYSLIHVPRQSIVKALTEFKRVLRPNGVVLITHHIGVYKVHREEWFGKEVSLDFLFFETNEMKDYVNRSGLLQEEVIERDPYAEFEYPSRRAYLFARKS
jgi:RimJ/RimL family protein N-acetyltransferase/SAM-dependent methyltransferase